MEAGREDRSVCQTDNLRRRPCKSSPRSSSYCREGLRKWKSLEGDWTTFSQPEGNRTGQSDDGDTTSSEARLSPDQKFEVTSEEDEWSSVSTGSTHQGELERQWKERTHYMADSAGLRLVREEVEGSWSPGDSSSPVYDQGSLTPALLTHPHLAHSCFHSALKSLNRAELDVVNSSYPLLKENFSLLEKLKRERDACRQLEINMKDLEGQIQDVSKSFELEMCVPDLHVRELRGSGEVGYMPQDERDSPRLSYSFERICQEEDLGEEDCDPEAEPLLAIEHTFSKLLHFSEKLDRCLGRSEQEEDSPPIHLYPRKWQRGERWRELCEMPRELMLLLEELRMAIHDLIASLRKRKRDEDCSSAASFTFHGFSDSRPIVPTIRTIFSPAGNAIERCPLQLYDSSEDNVGEQVFDNLKKNNHSQDSEEITKLQNPPSQNWPISQPNKEKTNFCDTDEVQLNESPEPEGKGSINLTKPKDTPLGYPTYHYRAKTLLATKPLGMKGIHERCSSDVTYGSNYHPSSEIIKRIERLQELVKPELCESLKQRALKIQKAKEEFLLGVSSAESERGREDEENDILVEELCLPNGLTVKEEGEDVRERSVVQEESGEREESSSSEESCRQSLILHSKSDWLRNPFRPKGKYKINK